MAYLKSINWLSSRPVRYLTSFIQVIYDLNSYTEQKIDFSDGSRKVSSNLWTWKQYCCTIAQVLGKKESTSLSNDVAKTTRICEKFLVGEIPHRSQPHWPFPNHCEKWRSIDMLMNTRSVCVSAERCSYGQWGAFYLLLC